MVRPTVFLMYHELEVPGRALCRKDRGYTRYVVLAEDFRRQLDQLGSLGFEGMNVSDALSGAHGRGVAITFDDGCETDLLVAAPLLEDAGFQATFFIVAGLVGQPGYLTGGQIRELQERGFEIGCHSMTHAYLSDLDANRLHVEVVQAKDRLEQLTGQRVDHFSCPGGRFSAEAARLARQAGYVSMATSSIGANSPDSDRFRLARLAIKRRLPAEDFERLVQGKGLWRRQIQAGVLAAAKGLLGNSMYERLRSVVLGP